MSNESVADYYAKAEEGTPHCTVQLFHGPGHQSRTTCDVEGEHTIHHVIYGELQQDATWQGGDAFTGFMDEPEGIHPASSQGMQSSPELEEFQRKVDAERVIVKTLVKRFSKDELGLIYDDLHNAHEPTKSLAHVVGMAWATYRNGGEPW
jgi:hypothetical protein